MNVIAASCKSLISGNSIEIIDVKKARARLEYLTGSGLREEKIKAEHLRHNKLTDYLLTSGHHDVVQLVTSLGVVVASFEYDAFGVIVEEEGDGSNPYRYSGYFYDVETMLYYIRCRYYDAGIARFLQEDTYYGDSNDPLSLNLYAYCRNNPLIYWCRLQKHKIWIIMEHFGH